ncbi:hypothetical protein NIES4075_35340 [Tolypothrix sp. NIES-4075]|uniref:hypothetical protein n=1 Tax=Tolypothrix sp. NIES-4075 TaxID=2005459 RepID=UPI000B5C2C4C|nr:hypothetical protein [Tolypothrix sp. NIES-4075]GAX42533.1 hypothetical protein NIES4075_35340 [Tolypothrix sp. NIES-4075]
MNDAGLGHAIAQYYEFSKCGSWLFTFMWKTQSGSLNNIRKQNYYSFLYLEVSSTKSFKP